MKITSIFTRYVLILLSLTETRCSMMRRPVMPLQGAGGPLEPHLYRIIKAFGGFRDNFRYPGDIST